MKKVVFFLDDNIKRYKSFLRDLEENQKDQTEDLIISMHVKDFDEATSKFDDLLKYVDDPNCWIDLRLDHDLHENDALCNPYGTTHKPTGFNFVMWLLNDENSEKYEHLFDKIENIYIHSYNDRGAIAMAGLLHEIGYFKRIILEKFQYNPNFGDFS